MAPSALQHCLSGSLAQLGKGAACTVPPTTALFTALPAKEATEQGRIAALHPLVSLFFFSSMKPAQNFMRSTFCSRDACSLACIFLEQAAAIPSSRLGFKVVRYKCQGLRFCPASLRACNAPEQNSQKRIRAALRNSLFPVWARSPHFHALVTSFSQCQQRSITALLPGITMGSGALSAMIWL